MGSSCFFQPLVRSTNSPVASLCSTEAQRPAAAPRLQGAGLGGPADQLHGEPLLGPVEDPWAKQKGAPKPLVVVVVFGGGLHFLLMFVS